MRSIRVLVTIWVLVGPSVGCGWQEKAEFVAQQGDARIRIYQPFPINDAGLKVVLLQNGREFELSYRRADTFLQFVDVWWAPDHSSVAVFSCGIAEVAYDLKAHRLLSFSRVRSNLAEHIRSEYRLPKDQDSDAETFSWACSAAGQEAFFKRHPEARAF